MKTSRQEKAALAGGSLNPMNISKEIDMNNNSTVNPSGFIQSYSGAFINTSYIVAIAKEEGNWMVYVVTGCQYAVSEETLKAAGLITESKPDVSKMFSTAPTWPRYGSAK